MGPMEKDPIDPDQLQGHTSWDLLFPFPSLNIQCFALVLCVHNKDGDMLNYLLNSFSQEGKVVAYPLWNSEQLSFILRGVIAEQWLEGLTIVLKGNCAQHLYLCMDYFQRLDFIGERIG